MHRRAVNHLRKVDPVLARVITTVGKCDLVASSDGHHMHALIQSIVYQQLSGKAAATILSRVLALYGGRYPEPDEILATPSEVLRAAGLSGSKVAYIQDLAHRVHTEQLPLHDIHTMDDADIERTLCTVRGIGRWTAQMFLMFRLGRPDVLPETDLAIRKAVMQLYRLRKMPTPERVRAIGAKWSPYASVASWYLWRIVDQPEPVAAKR